MIWKLILSLDLMAVIIISTYKTSLFSLAFRLSNSFDLSRVLLTSLVSFCSTWQPSAFQLAGYVMGQALHILSQHHLWNILLCLNINVCFVRCVLLFNLSIDLCYLISLFIEHYSISDLGLAQRRKRVALQMNRVLLNYGAGCVCKHRYPQRKRLLHTVHSSRKNRAWSLSGEK